MSRETADSPGILILFAHPALEKSRVHRRLVAAVRDLPGVTLHDLYEAYPSFDVEVEREQALLLAHEIVVFQHPFYWYSTPALLKEWQDLVLEYGWAFGHEGRALEGKRFLSAISTGGDEESYRAGGANSWTMDQLLRPLEQTAKLCGMHWLQPYVIHGTHSLSAEEIETRAGEYRRVLVGLLDGSAPRLPRRGGSGARG